MPPITTLTPSAYRFPTDAPESDGTFAWDSTTAVVVEASAGGHTGLGYSYTHHAAAVLVRDMLADVVRGRDALDVQGAWEAMNREVRNIGRPGLASCAIAAVDAALWDLKGRLLGTSVVALLGAVREGVMAYGSGGFTSYDDSRLAAQLGGWAREGLRAVKMKIGREPARDGARMRVAREAIGPDVALFIDANGAYGAKPALRAAEEGAAVGVRWFEEPVSSDDLDGLRLLRERGPAGMDIAAGEYGFDELYFRRMLDAGAVDVLQADATRCGGITGFLRAGALCAARSVPLSAHTAPSLHAHPACALGVVRHVEHFHDHARVERLLFDGALAPVHGDLVPDRTRPGLGLELKRADAARYAVWPS